MNTHKPQMNLAIGRVLAALERNGLSERTVVIFMSDNGGLATAEGHPTSNLPLRAGKGWPYEGASRQAGCMAQGSQCRDAYTEQG